MSRRRDKMLAITRYLTGRTGIPGLAYHGPEATLIAPWPYEIRISTDRSLGRLSERIKALQDVDEKKIPVVIRYDGDLDTPPNAWAVMRLETFCRLAKLHYDTEIAGRGD